MDLRLGICAWTRINRTHRCCHCHTQRAGSERTHDARPVRFASQFQLWTHAPTRANHYHDHYTVTLTTLSTTLKQTTSSTLSRTIRFDSRFYRTRNIIVYLLATIQLYTIQTDPGFPGDPHGWVVREMLATWAQTRETMLTLRNLTPLPNTRNH